MQIMFVSLADVLRNASGRCKDRATPPVTPPLDGVTGLTTLFPGVAGHLGNLAAGHSCEVRARAAGAGEEEFKALKVSLREHEIDQVRAFVYHVFHAGPFTASHRGAGVPHDRLFIAVKRDGVPAPAGVPTCPARPCYDDPPATGARV